MGKTSLFLFFSGSRRSHQYVLKIFVKMLPPLGEDESGCGTVAVLWVSQEECQAVVEGLCLGVYTMPCSPAALQMLSANLT